MSTSPIPSDLRASLPHPETPWKISDHLFQRLQGSSDSKIYKKCELLPFDPEWKFVFRYFHAHKPSNRSIKKIWCIHNPSTTQQFEGKLYSMESEATNSFFKPKWDQEPQVAQRQHVIDRWKKMCAPFAPFSVSQHSRNDKINHVRILPVWHGSNPAKSDSICSSGFTFFGKHDLKHYTGGAGPSTDIGYFGSGIYFTPNARYAADIYSSQGQMLLSWISMREPYPVVADGTKLGKSSDMKKLEGDGGAYQNYNAHFIPVVPAVPGSPVYYPCPSNQTTSVDELVVFNSSQTLTRFLITMEIDLPKAPSNFGALFLQKVSEVAKGGHFHPNLTIFAENKKSASSSALQPEEEGLMQWATQFLDPTGNLAVTKLKSFLETTFQDSSTPSKLQKHYINDPDIKKVLATYIAPQGAFRPSCEDIFPLEEEVFKFFKSDKKVLLLLGGSGAGKTTFGQYLTYRLWSQWKEGDPMVLFIPPSISKNSHNAIETTLAALGFSPEEISHLKGQPFVFIFDGYDEIGEEKNLYQENRIYEWNAHVIIACRTQHPSANDPTLFAPLRKDDTPDRLLLNEVFIAPFTDKEIEAYLSQYLKQADSPIWTDVQQYLTYIDQIPGLKDLISTPFLLHAVVEVLPDIVREHAEKYPQEKLKLLKVDLYDALMTNWFDRAQVRLRQSGHKGDLKRNLLSYCKKLAAEMFARKTTVAEYIPPTFGEDESPWERFFGEKVSLLCQAAPLQKVGENSYSFLHKSLLEYFAFRAVYDEINKPTTLKGKKPARFDAIPKTFRTRLLTEEPAIIQFYADKISTDPNLKTVFFRIIEASKTDSSQAIAAANSITILNAARIPFSRMDLKRIQVPGANLYEAIFDGTQLDGANLKNVILNHAFLKNCSLKGAQMGGVRFGERAYLKHHSPVNCIAYSPDGKMMATGSDDKTVRLWDVASGTEISILKGHTDKVDFCTFSPDGKTLASASLDCTVRLWDVDSGNEVYIFEYVGLGACSCAFFPDGQYLAIGHDRGVDIVNLGSKTIEKYASDGFLVGFCTLSPDGKLLAYIEEGDHIRLWDVVSEKEIDYFYLGYSSCAFSPDGKTLAIASWNRDVELRDLVSRKSIRILKGHEKRVTSCAYSPDGKTLATASEDLTVRLWNVASGKQIATFRGDTMCTFSPDGKTLAVASWNGIVRLWDVDPGMQISNLRLKEHTGEVEFSTLSPDGKTLVIASENGVVRIWDIDSRKEVSNFQGDRDPVDSCIFSPNGKTLAVASRDDTVRLWDVVSGELISVFSYGPRSFAFLPDGKTIAYIKDETVWLRDVDSGKEISNFQVQTSRFASFSQNGKTLAVASRDDTVRLWDVVSGELISVLKDHTSKICSFALSPDGKILAMKNWRDMRIWDIDSKKEISNFQVQTNWFASFSQDGKTLVTTSEDKTVRLWDVTSGKEISILKDHAHWVESCTFSPDGKTLASASWYQTVRLWDVASGKEISVLKGHTDNVKSCTFSPDGKTLISVSYNQILNLWELYDAKGVLDPRLIWSSSPLLLVEGANLKDAKLSEANATLLKQRGAIGL